MPRPPTRTRGGGVGPRICAHASSASAASDPWARLDMSSRPSTRMTYSPPRRYRTNSPPPSARPRPSVSQGITGSLPPAAAEHLFQLVVRLRQRRRHLVRGLLLLGRLVDVQVRVVLAHEAPVRAPDLLVARPRLQLQPLV